MATVVIKDQVTKALRELPAELDRTRLSAPIGRAEVGLFQKWLQNNPPNKMGWPSTGFWADAARSTHFTVMPDGVLVSISKQGMLQRYKGGTIKPVNAKYLTIPARAEAYGKRAGEFNNLVVATRKGGTEAWALIEAQATKVGIGRVKKSGTRTITNQGEIGGLVMFWLVKSVHQNPDPSVIPPDNLIVATAIETAGDIAERALKK